MTSHSEKPGSTGGIKRPPATKADRSAAALRANLKRRKTQARDRAEADGGAPDETPKAR
jgi:hypothetical protein